MSGTESARQTVYDPAMSTAAATTGAVEGTIERVTYHNADNGFAVIQLNVRGRRDLVTVVGCLAAAIAGEFVEASGRWVIDKQHGQQFRADSMRTTHPSTPEGMEKYLGSGLIKGIGPVFAGKLVQAFGEQVFEVIADQPGRLIEVPGIGPTRQQRITQSWHEQRVVREIMVFLQGHGMGKYLFHFICDRIYNGFGCLQKLNCRFQIRNGFGFELIPIAVKTHIDLCCSWGKFQIGLYPRRKLPMLQGGLLFN